MTSQDKNASNQTWCPQVEDKVVCVDAAKEHDHE